ncbi:MAG: cation:proton antiporter [Chloroflexota bacterium]|nr:cation:proton antiporter [Chloroflexota bacterium]
MTEELRLILDLTIALAAALVGGAIAHRLRQSVIVGYLIAGMVIATVAPGLIGSLANIRALADVGIIFLMFALGIEFSLKELMRVRGVAIGGTLIQMSLLIALGIGLGALLGWPLEQGLFFGGVISVSSTAVILKTLLERGEVASPHGRTLLGMLIVQDLLVVLLIVLLPQLTTAGSGNTLGAVGIALAKTIIFVAAAIFLGVRVVPLAMARVASFRVPELFLLAAVAVALGVAMVGAALGLSPALGAFLGGLMLTETEFDHRVLAEVAPMRNVFATLFFVTVGMLIDVRFVGQHLLAVAGLVVFIIVAKIVATLAGLAPFRPAPRTALYTAFGMIQFGEFSYVLAQTGHDVGAISSDFNALLLAASVVTIVLTPAAFWAAPQADGLLARLPFARRWAFPTLQSLAEDEALSGHVIVTGYGRVGQHVAEALRASGMPVVVIEDDLMVAQALRAQAQPVIFGDATNARILLAARLASARALIACLPDSGATHTLIANARRLRPDLTILARIARREDFASLQSLNVRMVLPEHAGAHLLLALSEQALGIPMSEEALAAMDESEARLG